MKLTFKIPSWLAQKLFARSPRGFPKLERYAVWSGKYGFGLAKSIDKKV